MASVPEQIIAKVFAGLLPSVSTAIGERERHANQPAPRVVAIPRGAPVLDLPDIVGQQRFVDTDTGSTVSARRLLLRRFQIDWICHGAPDFQDAEELFIAVITMVRKVCHHSVTFSGEEWADQQTDQDGFDKYGSVIAFTSVIDIPIMDIPTQLKYLTANPPVQTTSTLKPTGDL